MSERQEAPYRQRLGKAAAKAELAPLLDVLAPHIRAYAASPPSEANAIFALAGEQGDLPPLQQLAERWKKQFNALVVVGAGGSGLSGKALAMLGHGPWLGAGQRALHVLDNCDALTLPALLASLDLETTCFLAVSKSGNTVETLAQLQLILQSLRERNIKPAGRMAVITVPGESPLAALAAAHGLGALPHAAALCGRFSMLSGVGLIPAAFMDIDIAALRRGAEWGLKANLHAGSPAATGAALQVAMLRAGRNINVMVPYAEQLWGLALWWRQSWAESLGKGASSTPLIAVGTADQHSQLQLFLDGPDDKLFTLLLTDCAGLGPVLGPESVPPYLAGHTLGDIVAAQQRATAETLERHGRPLRVFDIPRPDAYALGALVMHFTLEIMFAAALMGVNPFDQPAVEESKRLAHHYLTGKP